MADGRSARYADALTRYSRYVAVALVVATLLMGASAGGVDSGLSISSFGSDSEEAQKLDYVRENFDTGDRNTTSMQVVVRGDDVLSKASLLETLRFQQALREDDSIAPTLRDNRASIGIGNLVATAAVRAENGGSAGGPPAQPTLDEQITHLESMSEDEVADTISRVLDPDSDSAEARAVNPFTLLSTDYEAGSTSASARVVFVFQQTDGGDSLSDAVAGAQLDSRDVAAETIQTGEPFVFGAGIVDEEAGKATGESFLVITPVALALILVVLGLAYRDVVDVLLALVGIVVTLVWMAGFMGWAGIGVTQILIAVPFLLVGLSIDYALHVVMRYREAQEADIDASPRAAMRVGLAGVSVALAATTFTTAVGFLSNTVSPIRAISEFGVVSAAGIVSAFVVFAALLPAVKVEVDALLERFGVDRQQPAFGTSGAASRLVGVGTTIARRAPIAVIVVALVVSAGGGYAATDIDTSIDQVDFLPRDSPGWMDALPAPLAPSDYQLRENAVFLNDNFAQSRDRTTVHVLIEGPVTDPDTLERVAAGGDAVAATTSAVTLANGRPALDSPVTAIRATAGENETFAALVDSNDADGDGIPDENLAQVYDALYEAAPDRASAVVYRSDGEYQAVDLRVTVSASTDTATITSEMRGVADDVRGDSTLTVTATGPPIVDEVVQSALLRTLVETFILTLGVILAFLTALFYWRHGAPVLGAVTMVPVVTALGWILGAMYLLDIPFTTETAVIASIAIGLGVDYAIHVSERFLDELDSTTGVYDALDATVQGTGGALLASATSTAAGFGVLVFALVPSLRRFGAVTSTAIVFAFVASVLVLPSLLSLWCRYAGPSVAADRRSER
jgi:predicted RND superfamily exporter protein